MDIKPCPFCGHTPLDEMDFLHPIGTGWRDDPIGDNDTMMRHYMRMNDPRGVHGQVWEMNCLEHEGGCGASMHGDSREEVVAKWNRRPIDKMVNRFLGWPLPKTFYPDCGISFDGRKDDQWNKNKTWPIGTNLLTAVEAKAMFEYVLGITNER